jgi:hypothetical protein
MWSYNAAEIAMKDLQLASYWLKEWMQHGDSMALLLTSLM